MSSSHVAIAGFVGACSALVVACSFGLDSAEFSGGDDGASSGTDASSESSGSSSSGSSGTGASDASSSGDAALDGPATGDADTGPPPPCVNAGDRCPDGTILVGTAGTSAVKLYTTPCDLGQTFQSGVCNGNRALYSFNDGNAAGGVFVGVTSAEDGAGNTAMLAFSDANADVAGAQPHQAAKACWDLVAFGHDDWYLPSSTELDALYTKSDVIKNFAKTGGDSAPFYKTSTETHDATQPLNAARLRFSDGYLYLDGDGKPSAELVRCIRK